MKAQNDDLICYKKIPIDAHGKLKFFLEKHSTKEGTWGYLTLHEGEIDFVFLDGVGEEFSRIRLNKNNPELSIPPASWHKIIPVSKHFNAHLQFYCKPHRYFNKKYHMGALQSDLFYAYQTYLDHQKQYNILDVGCGSGRNLLYFAKLGHPITGVDINQSALENIKTVVKEEGLTQVDTLLHDINQPLTLIREQYHFVFSTVTLQFLNPERIPSLLMELEEATAKNGYHFLVFPVQSERYSLPNSFTFLPKQDELYYFYQNRGWSVLEYKESVGHLHKKDESGRPIPGLFGFLLAQKII